VPPTAIQAAHPCLQLLHARFKLVSLLEQGGHVGIVASDDARPIVSRMLVARLPPVPVHAPHHEHHHERTDQNEEDGEKIFHDRRPPAAR
jgi:hypothetical protein